MIKKSKFYKQLVYKEEDDYLIEKFIENKKIDVSHIRNHENRIKIQKSIVNYHNNFPSAKNRKIQLVQLYQQKWNKITNIIE